MCSAHLVCHDFKRDSQRVGRQGLIEDGGIMLSDRIIGGTQALKYLV